MEEVDLIFLLRGEKEGSGEGLVILNTELDVELLLAVLGSDFVFMDLEVLSNSHAIYSRIAYSLVEPEKLCTVQVIK